jgi:hypothetical protein
VSSKNTPVAYPNLLDLAEAEERRIRIEEYRQKFARSHHGPYAVQWPGRGWKTKYKSISDPLLKAHLAGLYWVAVKASWYPVVYFLDIDSPEPGMVERIIATLGLREGQYLLMTSPSYLEDGSLHMALMVSYKDQLPTHKLGYTALTNTLRKLCEVYPQLRRKFRLPLGRGQRIIGRDGVILDAMPWWDAMYWLDKLDPVPIETMIFQPELPFPSLAKDEDDPRHWLSLGAMQQLYEEGLQGSGMRHESQWDLAVGFWRVNWMPDDAIAEIRRWIRNKHNGLSKAVNKGAWRTIDAEIFRQAQWIWANFRPFPDTPHNLDGYVTMADLRFIAEVYPCNVINQKRLFALIRYMRPRAHHDFVYVPYRVWREQIANDRTYHAFRQDLESKGLLESVMSYRHVEHVPAASYSRKFRLRLPGSNNQPIQYDGRNADDYYEALRLALGSVREMEAMTGVPKRRFYEALRKQKE